MLYVVYQKLGKPGFGEANDPITFTTAFLLTVEKPSNQGQQLFGWPR